MTKYEVVADIVGVPSDNPKEEPPTYYSRTEKVDIADEKVAKRLLDLGAIKKPGGKVKEAEATSAEATAAPAAPEAETLTHKQALVKEAQERGLDTEGTIPELEKRIAEDKEREEAGS